jgi:hypothetical protein
MGHDPPGVLLQLAAAVVSSWFVWPAWAAAPATALAAATVVTERRRWKWLLASHQNAG